MSGCDKFESFMQHQLEQLYLTLYDFCFLLRDFEFVNSLDNYFKYNFNKNEHIKMKKEGQMFQNKIISISNQLVHLKQNYSNCWDNDHLDFLVSLSKNLAFKGKSQGSLSVASGFMVNIGNEMADNDELFMILAGYNFLVDKNKVSVLYELAQTPAPKRNQGTDFLYLFCEYFCVSQNQINKAKAGLKKYLKKSKVLDESVVNEDFLVIDAFYFLGGFNE